MAARRVMGAVVGGFVVVAASFTITTLLLQHFMPGGENGLDDFKLNSPAKLTSVTLASGVRLIYPISETNEHGPALAFDGSTSPNSFWEVAGSFPFTLTVALPQPRILSSYSIDAGETVDRMPSDWIVAGSVDGREWKTIDQERNVPAWQPGEKRTYKIDAADPLSQIQFTFRAGLQSNIMRIYEIELH